VLQEPLGQVRQPDEETGQRIKFAVLSVTTFCSFMREFSPLGLREAGRSDPLGWCDQAVAPHGRPGRELHTAVRDGPVGAHDEVALQLVSRPRRFSIDRGPGNHHLRRPELQTRVGVRRRLVIAAPAVVLAGNLVGPDARGRERVPPVIVVGQTDVVVGGYALVGGTQVTDAGVAELQKALPKCSINR